MRTGSKARLRPYQPMMPPPLPPAQMGGTGLSGLALAEDGRENKQGRAAWCHAIVRELDAGHRRSG